MGSKICLEIYLQCLIPPPIHQSIIGDNLNTIFWSNLLNNLFHQARDVVFILLKPFGVNHLQEDRSTFSHDHKVDKWPPLWVGPSIRNNRPLPFHVPLIGCNNSSMWTDVMWDRGWFRVCGGDFDGIGEERGIGDWIWSWIAIRILSSSSDLIQSMRLKRNTQIFIGK